jgi:RNA polymerase sigma-70 factor (ECF subfamily)
MVPSPEEDMINDQAIERLIRAIQKMPDIYRRVAELRFIHDYPLDEIAKELSLPLNTVKTRVNRSKKQLHKIWKS